MSDVLMENNWINGVLPFFFFGRQKESIHKTKKGAKGSAPTYTGNMQGGDKGLHTKGKG